MSPAALSLRHSVLPTEVRRHVAVALACLLLWLGLAACDSPPGTTAESSPQPPAPLAIAGVYTDQFACVDTITSTTWTVTVDPVNFCGGIYRISQYSNAGEYIIAQNDATNSFDASLWSRFDWVAYLGHLYYCQTAFSAASEADALATPRAVATNPTTSGCDGVVNNFSWTALN